jgi:hypothetical protein
MVKTNIDPENRFCVNCKYYEPLWRRCQQDPKSSFPVDWFDTCDDWKEYKNSKKEIKNERNDQFTRKTKKYN